MSEDKPVTEEAAISEIEVEIEAEMQLSNSFHDRYMKEINEIAKKSD